MLREWTLRRRPACCRRLSRGQQLLAQGLLRVAFRCGRARLVRLDLRVSASSYRGPLHRRDASCATG
eukprot:4215514-Heterocapsa_arctica.AAC.1